MTYLEINVGVPVIAIAAAAAAVWAARRIWQWVHQDDTGCPSLCPCDTVDALTPADPIDTEWATWADHYDHHGRRLGVHDWRN